jgi:hypothetical protein
MKRLVLVFLTLATVLMLGCDSTSTTNPGPGTASPTSTPASSSVPTSAPSPNTTSQPTPTLNLEDYNGGFFSIKKPVGWDIVTAGSCSTFAFCIRDKKHPANQIFYFNELGPVYLAEEQKTIDKNYVNMGGSLPSWFEMPVVNPLTPENYLSSFELIADTSNAKKFMQGFPELRDIEIISVVEEKSPILGGQTKTIRALFQQGSELGEGLFYITVAPLIPLTGFAWGGTAYGYVITGITSIKSDFGYLQETLTQSLRSLNISQSYVDNCLNQQQQQVVGILKAGKTLSETSDIIMDVWESRNRSDDIISEKRSDAILDNERVYNPDTGAVYEVPLGFYDEYNLHREQYNMDNLQLLPDNDWNLWTAPTEPGDDIH